MSLAVNCDGAQIMYNFCEPMIVECHLIYNKNETKIEIKGKTTILPLMLDSSKTTFKNKYDHIQNSCSYKDQKQTQENLLILSKKIAEFYKQKRKEAREELDTEIGLAKEKTREYINQTNFFLKVLYFVGFSPIVRKLKSSMQSFYFLELSGKLKENKMFSEAITVAESTKCLIQQIEEVATKLERKSSRHGS